MSDLAESISAAFARRVAERDNPPPPPPLSQEPAAVQARVEAWLQKAHAVSDPRGRLRLARMVLALMQHPTRTSQDLIAAAGLTARAGSRTVERLGTLEVMTYTTHSYWRYWRLTPAAEDELLVVVLGPEAAAAAAASAATGSRS